MPSPIANLDGNANLLVNATGATGASETSQYVDIALGKPCLEALADICNAFKIRKSSITSSTSNRLAFKLQTAAASDLKMYETFLSNGINEGDTIKLVDV